MSRAVTPVRLSSRSEARLAGALYVLTIAFSLMAFFDRDTAFPARLASYACFFLVTLLLFDVFRPVSLPISLVAACFGVAGCVVAILRLLAIASVPVSASVFFGFYCLLVGFLIVRSTLLPHSIGSLMIIAGLSWLTFLWPDFAKSLSPYNRIPGFIAESALAIWLLVAGVDFATSRSEPFSSAIPS